MIIQYLYILGNKIGRYDVGRIAGFIKSEIFPKARHYIISRTFREKLFLPNAHLFHGSLQLNIYLISPKIIIII